MRTIGAFILFLADSFRKIVRFRLFFKLFIEECFKSGYRSLVIVTIVATFTGAVSVIQTSYNLTSPYLQDYIVAMVVRDMAFAIMPTLIALVYAGKVGSHIAGELGTMRITEQVDALEVMGINSASYLVLPKILSSLIMLPALVILAIFLDFIGAYLAVSFLGIISVPDYVTGIRAEFNPFIVTVVFVKSVFFGFMVASISAYKGFYTYGGALEVGRASTRAVINSCISILAADFLLTQLMVGRMG